MVADLKPAIAEAAPAQRSDGLKPRSEAGRQPSVARTTNDRGNCLTDHPHPPEEKKWPAPLRLAGARRSGAGHF